MMMIKNTKIAHYFFNNKFPVLKYYITEEKLIVNMVNNKDFYNKYQKCETLIETFIIELNHYFGMNEVASFIEKIVYKLPEAVMRSFIVAYLNSDKSIKADSKVYEYYQQTAALCSRDKYDNGPISFIEQYGIFREDIIPSIPNLINEFRMNEKIMLDNMEIKELNKEFVGLNHNYYFNGISLKEIFDVLSLNQKRLLNGILKGNNFTRLFSYFDENENYTHTLGSLLYMFDTIGLDTDIINSRVFMELNSDNVFHLVLQLLSTYDKDVVRKVKILINNEKYEFLQDLIVANKIANLCYLEDDELLRANSMNVIYNNDYKKKERENNN